MVKYKIVYDRGSCIGAGACAAMDSAHFKMAGDGKADLVGGKEVDGKFELEIDESPAMLEAAKACPVEVIKVMNAETGEKLA